MHTSHPNQKEISMTKITQDSVVQFLYTLTDEDGQELDKSTDTPLAYLHGHQNIIPGLENALLGKQAGDELSVTIAPADAYGEFIAEAVQSVPKSNFQGVDNIQAGMQFQTQTEDGQVMLVTVKDVTDDEVVVDGNHPLAGQTLHFDVKIVSVREATKEELEHGHAHEDDVKH